MRSLREYGDLLYPEVAGLSVGALAEGWAVERNANGSPGRLVRSIYSAVRALERDGRVVTWQWPMSTTTDEWWKTSARVRTLRIKGWPFEQIGMRFGRSAAWAHWASLRDRLPVLPQTSTLVVAPTHDERHDR
jgi:hypothetical protein